MHQLQCKCGVVRGHINTKGLHNRLICYCTDCRAYARFLTKAAAHAQTILDTSGGTEIIQVAQSALHFSSGQEQLAALKLTEKGMVRWYCQCCLTPIGNILASPTGAFIGLVHSCLQRAELDADFGNEVALLNTNTALGFIKQRGLVGVLFRFLLLLIGERLSGRYRQSPLFDAAGLLRVSPRILTEAELQQLKVAG
ncbi:DUF6151 family protein [Rheinheimera sp.]|uniref:DUF6151 family protein n=1 Tax=Rheinheimera sp. TaxID=1869214 RepID=UPI0027B895FD|nr:DUF6151 family protein [Rheinheimera sp.]